MRGKLRDKRATTRRDILKREMPERRHANKRDNRLPTQLEQFDDDDELELDEEPEENTASSKK